MSNREKCLSILDSFDDKQLVNIVALLQAAKNAISEAEEDAFCNALYNSYEADADKNQCVSIEEAAKALGVAL